MMKPTKRRMLSSAYAELVEYIRVAAQLAYEELSDIRHTEEQ